MGTCNQQMNSVLNKPIVKLKTKCPVCNGCGVCLSTVVFDNGRNLLFETKRFRP